MKNFKKLLIILVAVTFVMPACKKGANDPGISLKSRKARLVGTWELSEGTQSYVSGGSTYTYTYSGTTCTQTFSGTSVTYPYTEKIDIMKDGTFEITINDDGDLSTVKGSWFFGGKAKDLDLKNKESVIFRVTSEVSTSGGTTNTETYTGTQCPTYSMNIDELRSKKMVIVYDGTDTWSSSFSETGSMTYAQ